MASITVDVSEAIAKIDPRNMEKAIQESLGPAGTLVMSDVRPYPPPPPASKYIRTGALGRSWHRYVKPRQAIVQSENVPYAPYVQGTPGQAWMHAGRWQTVGMVAERMADPVKRLMEAALARWAR